MDVVKRHALADGRRRVLAVRQCQGRLEDSGSCDHHPTEGVGSALGEVTAGKHVVACCVDCKTRNVLAKRWDIKEIQLQKWLVRQWRWWGAMAGPRGSFDDGKKGRRRMRATA